MQTLELDIPTARWALPLLEPARYKGAKGGRAAGRSHFFAELAVEGMVADPNLRFVCIREVQRALRYSAKSLVESKIRALGVSHLFDILTTEIRRRGGEGVMIFEGMQDHTADSIKSLEGFGRAWVEEAHVLSERSLRLLRPTIRMPGSELWFSWNPESPDDPVDAFFAAREGNANVVLVHSTYEDNPFLPDEMRQEAESDRESDPDLCDHIWGGGYFIGGSGRVYSSFINKPWPAGNVDESIRDTGAELLVGMDFNVNPMTCVIAVRAADECHFIGSMEIQSSNTTEVAVELRTRYPSRSIVVCPDPSGRQRKTSAAGQTDFTILERAGFEVRAPLAAPLVRDRENNANKMYLDGERRRARVHPDAKELIAALSHMSFKEGTSQRDKKSRYDHICFAAGTPVMTPNGERPIESLRAGDMVVTRHGASRVSQTLTTTEAEVWDVEFDNGRRITATPDHPFWVECKGFIALRDVTRSDTLYACPKSNLSYTGASPIDATRSHLAGRTGSTSRPEPQIGSAALTDCTEKSGKTPMVAQSPRAITSTTSTTIRSTTPRRTSSANQGLGTSRIMHWRRTGYVAEVLRDNWTLFGTWLLNGIARKRVGRGTASTGCAHGSVESQHPLRAHGVALPSVSCISKAIGISVPRTAKPLNAAHPASTTRTAPAHAVAKSFTSTDTAPPKRVHEAARHISASTPAGRATVYNLTVDGPHEYFAGGVLVSNCDAADYLLWQEFNVLGQRQAMSVGTLSI